MKKIFAPLALASALLLSTAALIPPNPAAPLRGGWEPVQKPLFNQFDDIPGIVDAIEAYNLLDQALNLDEPFRYNGPEDSVYISPTQEDLDDLLSYIRKHRSGLPYLAQAFDCDDFATEAKYWATIWSYHRFSMTRAGLLFGKAYVKLDGDYSLLFPGSGVVTGFHVLNFVVRNDGQVFFFEPQSGRIVSVESFIYEGSVEVLKLEF